MKEALSEESLEQLYIAVIKLKTKSGLALALRPEDVLQLWVIENAPRFTWWLTPATNREQE